MIAMFPRTAIVSVVALAACAGTTKGTGSSSFKLGDLLHSKDSFYRAPEFATLPATLKPEHSPLASTGFMTLEDSMFFSDVTDGKICFERFSELSKGSTAYEKSDEVPKFRLADYTYTVGAVASLDALANEPLTWGTPLTETKVLTDEKHKKFESEDYQPIVREVTWSLCGPAPKIDETTRFIVVLVHAIKAVWYTDGTSDTRPIKTNGLMIWQLDGASFDKEVAPPAAE